MRTTVTIDDADMKALLQETRMKTRPAAIRAAIQGYLRQQKLERVLALRGSMALDLDLDEMRRIEIEDAERTFALWDE
ncbi:MAG: hypothetical protein U0470_14080 [Anaerolineae bacterium]